MNATAARPAQSLLDFSLVTASQQTEATKEQQLLKWTASLPAQPEDKQIAQLEAILTTLNMSTIDDVQRLQLMNTVLTALQRLLARLRKHYVHEVGALTMTSSVL